MKEPLVVSFALFLLFVPTAALHSSTKLLWGVCRGGSDETSTEQVISSVLKEQKDLSEIEESVDEEDSPDIFYSEEDAREEDDGDEDAAVEEKDDPDEPEQIKDEQEEMEPIDDNKEAVEDTPISVDESIEDDPSVVEGDSSAYVDRMEFADVYDEEEVEEAVSATQEEPVTETAAETTSSEGNIVPESEVSPKEAPSTALNQDRMKMLVKELNYRPREIRAMKEEVVAMIAENRLYRPKEGIPDHWYRPDAKKSWPISKIVSRVVLPVLTGALAYATVFNEDFELSDVFPTRSTVPATTSTTASSYSTAIYDVPSALTSEAAVADRDEPEEDKDTVEHMNEHVKPLGGVYPHSIKPGQRPKDELDVTWLDKAITKVENVIKAFLRMEI